MDQRKKDSFREMWLKVQKLTFFQRYTLCCYYHWTPKLQLHTSFCNTNILVQAAFQGPADQHRYIPYH